MLALLLACGQPRSSDSLPRYADTDVVVGEAPAPPDLDRAPGITLDPGGEEGEAPMDERWPVVIIGGGPAGLAVATELPAGLLIEGEAALGGRADRDGMLAFLVGTPEQDGLHVDDSVADALEDWETITGGEPTDLTEDWLYATPEIRDRLYDLGVRFEGPYYDPNTTTPRIHKVSTGGLRVVAALQGVLPAGVEVRTSTWVEDLIVQGGRVVGVVAGGRRIGADAVVIASGGFASNAAIIEEITGGAADHWPSEESTNGNGQALLWADAYGLGTACESCVGWFWRYLPEPISADDALVEVPTSAPAPWVWIDRDARRFIDETQTWSVTLGTAWDREEGAAALISVADLAGIIAGGDVPEGEGWGWIPAGVTCASQLENLAYALDMEAPDLANLRARLDTGDAGSTRRLSSTLPDLEDGGVCAIQPGRVAAKTFGGLAVDDEGRVLDPEGEVVPGLYAVGEAAGMLAPGWAGTNGVDGSLSAVVWSGWRVGEALADAADD